MSADMFLKIEGVEGEAVDNTHGGEIDVLAWSWGMSQSGSMHTGGGGGAGKVAVQDIRRVTKFEQHCLSLLKQFLGGNK